jgi:NADH dehydrogenase FAD-containing subunit
MNKHRDEPEFGATGQFELTGVYFVDKKAESSFATTLGMDRIKTLLMVGIGPAHLKVLTQLATHRRADVDVTLIHPWSHLTHPAMVPGFVAGHYPLEDCQINLQALLREAGVRWINARCGGLDASTNSVMLDYGANGPALSATNAGAMVPRPAMLTYDFLSVDCHTAMERRHLDAQLPGASEHGLLALPSEQFVNRWSQWLQRLKAQTGKAWNVTVVGADAPALELLFAVQQGLLKVGILAQLRLVTHDAALAPGFSAGVHKRLMTRLEQHHIDVLPQRCVRIHADAVELDDGQRLPSDLTLIATGGCAPDWLQHSGLAQDSRGLIQVNSQLQSVSYRNVFASGAVATRADRTDSVGMQADNVGSDLAINLLASLTEQPLSEHKPADRAIQVIACGPGHAIAQWGWFHGEGRWAWGLREKQDRAFVAQFKR